ncbi:MAG TPA: hypothetical protein DHU90_13190, partial [Sphingobacterium sp.]|nr:hypothetical protein [Sphingobacterium sp.]
MKNKILLFLVIFLTGHTALGQGLKEKPVSAKETDRAFWLKEMDQMLRPVLRSLAHDSLRLTMPQ